MNSLSVILPLPIKLNEIRHCGVISTWKNDELYNTLNLDTNRPKSKQKKEKKSSAPFDNVDNRYSGFLGLDSGVVNTKQYYKL